MIVATVGFIVAAAVAAWVAGRFMQGNGFGLPGDFLVGVIGAFAGGWIFRAAGAELGGVVGSIVVAFLSALLLLFIVRLFTGRRSGRKLWS